MSAETAALWLYGFYALVILAGGLLAVGSKSLVRALCGLILTLFGVSGMYLLMNAPFMALMQILIYVGAVTVLIFFAIMLTAGCENPKKKSVIWPLAILAAALPPLLIAWVLNGNSPTLTGAPVEVDLKTLGAHLLDEYVLAFELISVVLFVAMAGAVILGFKRKGES